MSEISLPKTFAESPNKEVLLGKDLNDNFEAIVTGSNDNYTLINAKQSSLTIANVKDYGAVGDGSTDDTQAFVDAIGSGNVIVYLPKPATAYLIKSTITVPSNTHFKALAPYLEPAILIDNTFTAAGSSTDKQCIFRFYGTNVNTRKTNISFDGIYFKNTGTTYTELNAVKGFFCDYINITNCRTNGLGLIEIRDVNDTIVNNSTNSYSTFTTDSLLNSYINISNNSVYAYDGTNYHDGIELDFCQYFNISNNKVVSSDLAIWWVGGAAIPANGGEFTNARKCKHGTVTGNVVYDCKGGIFGHGASNVSVSGNYISTVEDMGYDFEGCRDIICSGNYGEHAQNGVYGQFQRSKGVVFDGNIAVQDGTTRGRGAGWQGVRLYNDSAANASNGTDRQNIVKNNTFLYYGSGVKGEVALNWSEHNEVHGNRFLNTKIWGYYSSNKSFDFKNNTMVFTNTSDDILWAVRTPRSVYVGLTDLMEISGNKIISHVSQPAGSMGIRSNNHTGSTFTDAIIANNTIIGFDISIGAMAGYISGGTGTRYTLIKDNIVDGEIRNIIHPVHKNLTYIDLWDSDNTYTHPTYVIGSDNNYYKSVQSGGEAEDPTTDGDNTYWTRYYGSTTDYTLVMKSGIILDNNRLPTGKPYLSTIPVKDIWQVGQKVEYFDSVTPTGYIGAVCTTEGCAYKETWAGGGTYVTDDFVKGSDNKIYRAVADGGQAEDPTTDTNNTYWEAYCSTAAVFKGYGAIEA